MLDCLYRGGALKVDSASLHVSESGDSRAGRRQWAAGGRKAGVERKSGGGGGRWEREGWREREGWIPEERPDPASDESER